MLRLKQRTVQHKMKLSRLVQHRMQHFKQLKQLSVVNANTRLNDVGSLTDECCT
jgi:hypothetical protein